ncbi:MAG: hypothetical protein RBU37_23675, partial [Myxococcota bacterium]|nr:hypothetical protein [Myxococcota bacterium]
EYDLLSAPSACGATRRTPRRSQAESTLLARYARSPRSSFLVPRMWGAAPHPAKGLALWNPFSFSDRVGEAAETACRERPMSLHRRWSATGWLRQAAA